VAERAGEEYSEAPRRWRAAGSVKMHAARLSFCCERCLRG